MLFSDHFFLFYFFPVFFIFYLLAFRKITIANIVIIIFSLLFYASFGINNLPILIVPLLIDFGLAIILENTKNKKLRKSIVGLVVFLNVALLAYFKYATFAISNAVLIFPAIPIDPDLQENVILPLGISFITFQRISYIVDVYRKKIPASKNLVKFATYATIFPHLIAGPIVRYSNIKDELSKRSLSLHDIFEGSKFFIVGLVLKVLIADKLYTTENILTSNLNSLGSIEALTLIFFFSIRIYLDFAGYSFMAVGLARFMGFHFPQNFNSPYRSASITEFWQRWNITLSLWLRDYLYIPLGGNRKGKTRTYVNLMATMLIGGLWHGASWNFMLWGGLHGIYLSIERFASFKNIRFNHSRFTKQILVFLLVTFTWLTFLFTTPQEIVTLLSSFFLFKTPSIEFLQSFMWSFPSLLGGIIWIVFIGEEKVIKVKPSMHISLLLVLLFLLAIMGSLTQDNVPFIYFQF